MATSFLAQFRRWPKLQASLWLRRCPFCLPAFACRRLLSANRQSWRRPASRELILLPRFPLRKNQCSEYLPAGPGVGSNLIMKPFYAIEQSLQLTTLMTGLATNVSSILFKAIIRLAQETVILSQRRRISGLKTQILRRRWLLRMTNHCPSRANRMSSLFKFKVCLQLHTAAPITI